MLAVFYGTEPATYAKISLDRLTTTIQMPGGFAPKIHAQDVPGATEGLRDELYAHTGVRNDDAKFIPLVLRMANILSICTANGDSAEYRRDMAGIMFRIQPLGSS